MKPVAHPHQEQFALFSIPSELVRDYECPHLLVSPRPPRTPQGEHFGASLQLKPRHGHRVLDVFQVWTEQEGFWVMVAFHLDPHTDTRAVPGVKALDGERKLQPIEPITIDPSLVAAAESVLTKWLIDKDYGAASEYFSSRSYDCLNLFHEDGFRVEGKEGPELLRRRLEEMGDFVGESPSLESVIRPAAPWAPDVKIVSHDRAQAYALLSYPDNLSEQLDCRHRREGRYHHGERPRDHGRHFATAFHLRQAGDHPPVVTLLWAKEGNDWKIISLDVEMH